MGPTGLMMPGLEATPIIAVPLTDAVLAVMAASVEAGEVPQVVVQVVLPVEAFLADLPVELLTADLAAELLMADMAAAFPSADLVEVLLEGPATMAWARSSTWVAHHPASTRAGCSRTRWRRVASFAILVPPAPAPAVQRGESASAIT